MANKLKRLWRKIIGTCTDCGARLLEDDYGVYCEDNCKRGRQ